MDFFTGESVMDYGHYGDCLKLKCLNDKFVSYKHAAFHFMLINNK